MASHLTAGYLESMASGLCDDRIDLKYETVCRRPNEAIVAILAHVGVQAQPRGYGAMIGAATSQVLPDVARFRRKIGAKLSRYAEAVGCDLNELANSA